MSDPINIEQVVQDWLKSQVGDVPGVSLPILNPDEEVNALLDELYTYVPNVPTLKGPDTDQILMHMDGRSLPGIIPFADNPTQEAVDLLHETGIVTDHPNMDAEPDKQTGTLDWMKMLNPGDWAWNLTKGKTLSENINTLEMLTNTQMWMGKALTDSHPGQAIRALLGALAAEFQESGDPQATAGETVSWIANNKTIAGDAIFALAVLAGLKGAGGTNYITAMAGTGTALAAREIMSMLFGSNYEGLTADEMREIFEESFTGDQVNITNKVASSGAAPFMWMLERKKKKKKKKKSSNRSENVLGSVASKDVSGSDARTMEPGSFSQNTGRDTERRLSE